MGPDAFSKYLQSLFCKFSQARNTEVFPKWQHWLLEQLGVDNLTIDFHGTAITGYGDQQGGVPRVIIQIKKGAIHMIR